MCLDFITREKLIIISLRITAGIQVAAKYTKNQRMRYNNATQINGGHNIDAYYDAIKQDAQLLGWISVIITLRSQNILQ